MGFGLLVFGYITVIGVFPDLPVYFNRYAIFVAIGGGIILLASFWKLQEYNIYFKIMKYVSGVYILTMLGFMLFLIPEQSEEFMLAFMYYSKIIRIFLLFVFHYIMLTGIHTLAKSVDNVKILKNAKLNIYFTYVYFGLSIISIFDFTSGYYVLAVFLTGLLYYCRNFLCIYSCFQRITYKGHDEKIERKIEEKAEKARKKKNKN